MSHCIGSGTVNLSINVPRDERDVWGKIAFRRGAKSVGEFCKKMMLRGLEMEDAPSAAKLKAVRRQYYGMACAVVCLSVFLVSLICGDKNDVRRARRGRTRTEEARVEA